MKNFGLYKSSTRSEFLKKYNLKDSKDSGINIINDYVGCSNCHMGFQIDSFLEGCTHNCSYCFAKIEGELHDHWNKPVPIPLDPCVVREIFYKAFETDESSQWSNILRKKIPIRIGSLSDGFIGIEKSLRVTHALMEIFNHYRYPYIIVTRSDIVSEDAYLELLNPKFSSVQMSLPSLDASRTKILEPGAPSPFDRLRAIEKLVNNNVWVTTRINPLFPLYPDRTLSNELNLVGLPKFDFFSLDVVDRIAETGCKSILTGFVTLKSHIIDQLSSNLKFDLRTLLDPSLSKDSDFIFSQEEIRMYYLLIKQRAEQRKLQFSTCYLGQGEMAFFANQDLWNNKKDCCNTVGVVEEFKRGSVGISYDTNSNHGILAKLFNHLMKKINN